MNKELQDKIYSLVALKMAGSAGFEQLQELEELLKLYPDFKLLDDVLGKFPEIDQSVTTDITDQAFATQYVKMLYAEQERKSASAEPENIAGGIPSRKSAFMKFATIAAAFILLITLFKVILFSGDRQPAEKLAIQKDTIDANRKSRLVLPDGTIVYLNANSHLEYGDDFNTLNRDVILTGEAYFDVAHNANKPFIVHTSKATIRVLGTRFNVKNYVDEIWEATLLQGKIEMYLNSKPENKLTLEPSQKVSVSAFKGKSPGTGSDDFKIAVTKIKSLKNDVAETAWVDDKLVFVDQPLHEIAKQLERTFGITVYFKSQRVSNNKYTGVFKNDNLPQILEILDFSNPIEYELKENRLTIQ